MLAGGRIPWKNRPGPMVAEIKQRFLKALNEDSQPEPLLAPLAP
jgi:hypothetical protein